MSIQSIRIFQAIFSKASRKSNMKAVSLCALFWGYLIPLVYPSQCPDPDFGAWKVKDRECQQQDPTYRYHCQTDAGKDISTALCAPAINCTPGNRAKIDTIKKKVTCVSCSSRMYQPVGRISYRFTQPNCDRHVQQCGTGEIQCGASSPSQNYLCRCDHTKGMRPNIISKCSCFDKNTNPTCQCIDDDCKEGEVLSPDFSCVAAILVPSSPTPGPNTDTGSVDVPLVVGMVFVAVVVAIGIIAILVYCLYFKRRKKTSSSRSSSDKDVEKELLSKSPETTKDSIPSSETTSGNAAQLASSSEITRENITLVKSLEKKQDEKQDDSELYNRTKAMFVDSVNPHSILVRLELSPSDEEKEAEFIEKNGRERGAHHLLQTARRTHPDDWFERILQAMKDPNVDLTHVAEKMERIRDYLKGARNEQKCEHIQGSCENCTKTPHPESTDTTQLTTSNGESGDITVRQDGSNLTFKRSIVCQDEMNTEPTNRGVCQDGSNDDPTEREIFADGTDSDTTTKKEYHDGTSKEMLEKELVVAIPKKEIPV